MYKVTKVSKTQVTAECAVLAALSFALSVIPGISLPWGGTISWFSTVPILIAAMRHGFIWGTGTSFVYSLTQLALGSANLTYAGTFWPALGCAVLDYVAAYTALGCAGLIFRQAKRQIPGIISAVLVTGLFRYLCSFLSGVLIWSSYKWDGWSAVTYSLVYNAAWCVPDVIIALAGILALQRVKLISRMLGRPAVD